MRSSYSFWSILWVYMEILVNHRWCKSQQKLVCSGLTERVRNYGLFRIFLSFYESESTPEQFTVVLCVLYCYYCHVIHWTSFVDVFHCNELKLCTQIISALSYVIYVHYNRIKANHPDIQSTNTTIQPANPLWIKLSRVEWSL